MRLFIYLNSRNRNWLAVVRDTKFLCTFTLYCKTIEFDFREIFLKIIVNSAVNRSVWLLVLMQRILCQNPIRMCLIV